jgi:hypothetical protein
MTSIRLSGFVRSASGLSILWGGARQRARRPTLTVEPKLRQTILDTERLLKDDEPTSHALVGDLIQLEYYEDGYPTIPECLDGGRSLATQIG